MRRFLLVFFFAFSYSTAVAQKNYSLIASGNFDFLLSGLGTNDAGIGLALHSNFFTKQRLQLKSEASLDYFGGSKLLMIDSMGNHYGNNPTMIGVKAGPDFRITKKISVSALYGFVRYKWFADEIYSESIKVALTVQPPRHKNMQIGFHFTKMPVTRLDIHYFGVSVGFRII